MRRLFVAVFLLLGCAGVAQAWTSESGPFRVTSIRMGSGNLYVQLSPAPQNCAGGDQYRMHAYLEPTNPNYKEMAAVLVTAYLTGGKLLYIWVTGTGCSSTSALKLEMIELEAK
jgi:hypothetical protein